jgi:hypothetical protein
MNSVHYIVHYLEMIFSEWLMQTLNKMEDEN